MPAALLTAQRPWRLDRENVHYPICIEGAELEPDHALRLNGNRMTATRRIRTRGSTRTAIFSGTKYSGGDSPNVFTGTMAG